MSNCQMLHEAEDGSVWDIQRSSGTPSSGSLWRWMVVWCQWTWTKMLHPKLDNVHWEASMKHHYEAVWSNLTNLSQDTKRCNLQSLLSCQTVQFVRDSRLQMVISTPSTWTWMATCRNCVHDMVTSLQVDVPVRSLLWMRHHSSLLSSRRWPCTSRWGAHVSWSVNLETIYLIVNWKVSQQFFHISH